MDYIDLINGDEGSLKGWFLLPILAPSFHQVLKFIVYSL